MKYPTNNGPIVKLRFVGVIAIVLIHCAAVAGSSNGDLSPQQLENLPDSVPAKPGKATIYADWDSVKDGSVTVYIVNRTTSVIRFETLYGKLHLYNEAESKSGDWERSEVYIEELCGVGHGEGQLPPGTWVSQSESIGMPIQGVEKRPMRIRCYDHDLNTYSNVGTGYIYPSNIDLAKNDQLAIRTASLGRLKDILFSRDSANRIFQTSSSGPIMDPRRIALLAVASKWDDERSEVLAVLESIATGAIPDLKDEAASIVEQLRKKHEADKTR
jgi:hypothetical protein